MNRLTASFRKHKKQAAMRIQGYFGGLSHGTAIEPLPMGSTSAAAHGCPASIDVVSTTSNDYIQRHVSNIPTTVSSDTLRNINSTSVSLITTPSLIITAAEPHNNPQTSKLTLDKTRVCWAGLKALIGVMETAGRVLGPLKPAFEAISGCVELYENACEGREEYTALKGDLETRFQDLARFLSSPMPPTITPSINNLANGIIREINDIKKMEEKNALGRYTRATQDLDAVLKCYRRIDNLLDRLVQNANMNIWKTVDEHATERRLEKLGHSSAAWYSSVESTGRRNKCTPQTRSFLLLDMNNWAYHGVEKMYWLNGMAGTGKTTIAYSFSDAMNLDRKLAASFFCSRQVPSCRDVNIILPTISYQLARFSAPFRYALSRILEQQPDVHTRQFSDQFRALIAEPLQEVHRTMPMDLVVVIDGLDECESQDAVEIVLGILLSEGSSLPIKFFVSSRPEAKIISRMQNPQNQGTPLEFRLHELKKSIVRKDIETYLRTELEFISLSDGDIDTLTKQCGVLFIYAATAVRYIKADQPNRSPDRLKEVLEMPTLSVSDEDDTIDSLYTAILLAAFGNKKLTERDRREMIAVLHTVICAREPLTAEMIAGLLEIRNKGLVQAALTPFASVLLISQSEESVTPLHASFSDFLFNHTRSKKFHCNQKIHHARLAHACFDIMKAPLRPFNICGLESSFVLDKDVPGLDKKVEKAISAELFYACRYWGSHLELAETSKALFSALENFFGTRLLLWMEIMNLKKDMPGGARKISQVNAWCQNVFCAKEIRDMAVDASKFTVAFSLSPASESTPHIYISALALWPEGQPISRCYSQTIQNLTKVMGTAVTQPRSPLRGVLSAPKNVLSTAYSPDSRHIIGGVEDGMIRIWDAYTGQTFSDPLIGHNCAVSSVSYSPDGEYIASGSRDGTVRIWDVHTGKLVVDPLLGHSGWVLSVSYSPDGLHIVSGCDGSTIRVWDAKTGQMEKYTFEGHIDGVYSVSYSPDGTHIVSGSYDRTIRIWDAQNGQMISCLEGHTGGVYSVSYSHDGTRIASGSEDSTVRIWNAHIGQIVGKPLKGHSSEVHSVAYSPDGAHIVSGSADRTIRIWDAQTGQMVGNPLKGHTDPINSVHYSSNSAYIVSCSDDHTIRIWDAHTGQITSRPLEGHTGAVHSVSYLENGTHILSESSDGTMQTWDSNTGQMVGSSLGHRVDSTSLMSYSPDGAYRASCFDDNTIRIWDLQTGQMVGEPLFGHAGAVNSVSYSPDGAHIVSGSDDMTLQIWDAHTGQMVGDPLWGHTGEVYSVSYSPDGTQIVSGSYDSTVRIWDAHTGRMIGNPLEGHTCAVHSVSYSPDGAHIVSGSADRTIRVWDAHETKAVVSKLEDFTLASPILCSLSGQQNGPYPVVNSCQVSISDWNLGVDGWISTGSSKLLIWVPFDLQPVLCRPQNTIVISKRGYLRLEFSSAALGPSWSGCYKPINAASKKTLK